MFKWERLNWGKSGAGATWMSILESADVTPYEQVVEHRGRKEPVHFTEQCPGGSKCVDLTTVSERGRQNENQTIWRRARQRE